MYNLNYFNEIDTPNKAYFLGLLISNGSINMKKPIVELAVSLHHKAILEEFVKDIGGDLHIGKSGTSYKVYLCKPHIVQTIQSLGMIGKKCERVAYRTKFERDYIRGLFDGGGCLSLEKLTGKEYISLLCSYDIVKYVQDHFAEQLRIKPKKIMDSTLCKKIKYAAKVDVISIINYLYHDTSLYIRGRIIGT